MTGVTLHLDLAQWRDHASTLATQTLGLVPVAKGNGYGFGIDRLAAETKLLGTGRLAVGTVAEAEFALPLFDGDIVILQPWMPHDARATRLAADSRIITTVSRLADVSALAAAVPGARVVVEVLTCMRRHGISPEQLPQVDVAGLQMEGWTIHLPMACANPAAEAVRLTTAARSAIEAPLWLSHLPLPDYHALEKALGPGQVRLRMGTQLWLGNPKSMRTTATVLDVHPVHRGDKIGYWQRSVLADGHIIVVAGGTAHGIGLEAPSPVKSFRQRGIAFATGSLEAAGQALSPYTIDGKKRWFVEPPHMQSSLIHLPAKAIAPEVGDEINVEVRNTTATFDEVVTH